MQNIELMNNPLYYDNSLFALIMSEVRVFKGTKVTQVVFKLISVPSEVFKYQRK